MLYFIKNNYLLIYSAKGVNKMLRNIFILYEQIVINNEKYFIL